MAPGLYGLMGTLPPRGAHLSGRRQLLLRITEKKTWIQDMYIFTDQNLITLSSVSTVIVIVRTKAGLGWPREALRTPTDDRGLHCSSLLSAWRNWTHDNQRTTNTNERTKRTKHEQTKTRKYNNGNGASKPGPFSNTRHSPITLLYSLTHTVTLNCSTSRKGGYGEDAFTRTCPSLALQLPATLLHTTRNSLPPCYTVGAVATVITVQL